MKNRVDKPLIGLLAIGIIGGVILYHHLSTNWFCLAALFWVLVCYSWQNNREHNVPWYERMGAVFVSAILWTATVAAWYYLGYLFNLLMGHHTPWIICLIEGAMFHLIGWQLYDTGLSYGWWFNFKQYLYYLMITLSVGIVGTLVVRAILGY